MPSENTSKKSTNPDHNNKVRLSRRTFLTAELTAPLIIPRYVLGGTGQKPLSDILTIAAVGVGGMGRNYLERCQNERIVALCDLDHNLVQRRRVFDKYPNARRYHDFHKMFDKEAKNYGEWTKACKTGARTVCPIEFGCEMTEVALLGTLALRTRRLLEWDTKAMRVTNSEQANSLVDPPYRAGWSL